MEASSLAKMVAEAAEDTKALDVHLLNLSRLTSFTDFFVICSGTSDRQVRAIADNIQKKCKTAGFTPIGSEGTEKGEWALIDYGSVVAHIFHESVRDRYCLEKLWSDAPVVSYKVASTKAASS